MTRCTVDVLEKSAAVYELKHAEPKPEHLRQVSCYAAMYQAKLEENRARSDNPDSMPAAVAPAAVLMNTKKGTVEQVNAVRPAKVADMARAVQLQLWARAVAANNEDRVVPCDEAMSAGGIIALDVETDSYGCLIEIGAVACAGGTFDIRDTFHCVIPGVREETADDPWREKEASLTDIHGLVVVDRKLLSVAAPKVCKKFWEWVDRMTKRPVFAVYRGADLEKVQVAKWWRGYELPAAGAAKQEVAPPVSVDVNKIYKRWQEVAKVKRSATGAGTSLEAVSESLFGSTAQFAFHRAFEDAAITLAVLRAIVKMGGAV
jgi:hypothetical protein